MTSGASDYQQPWLSLGGNLIDAREMHCQSAMSIELGGSQPPGFFYRSEIVQCVDGRRVNFLPKAPRFMGEFRFHKQVAR